LATSSLVHTLKPSNSARHNVGIVQSRDGLGGGVFACQEGKGLLHMWAWQKVRLGSD
jgi:hypothetical protein